MIKRAVISQVAFSLGCAVLVFVTLVMSLTAEGGIAGLLVMAVIAFAVAFFFARGRRRILPALAVLFCMCLAVRDYRAGAELDARVRQAREAADREHSATQSEQGEGQIGK